MEVSLLNTKHSSTKEMKERVLKFQSSCYELWIFKLALNKWNWYLKDFRINAKAALLSSRHLSSCTLNVSAKMATLIHHFQPPPCWRTYEDLHFPRPRALILDAHHAAVLPLVLLGRYVDLLCQGTDGGCVNGKQKLEAAFQAPHVQGAGGCRVQVLHLLTVYFLLQACWRGTPFLYHWYCGMGLPTAPHSNSNTAPSGSFWSWGCSTTFTLPSKDWDIMPGEGQVCRGHVFK